MVCLFCSAKEDYKFRTMSPSGGFYYDGVIDIEQDDEGFIWIAMENELYRFDGFQYKKYYTHFASIDNTKRWTFQHIACSSHGDIYVSTSNGLYSYDKKTNNFCRIYGNVSLLEIDFADNLWIRMDNKWGILDVKTGKLTIPLFNGIDEPYVNATLCTYDHNLYASIGHRVYRFNYAKNEFSRYLSLPDKDCRINAIKAHQGKLWAYTNNNVLYKIDLSTFHVERQYNQIIGHQNLFRSLLIDKKGYIWIGTINGLYILDPSTGEYLHHTHSNKKPFSLPNSSIWVIREDRQQNIWIGTYSGFICYVNIDEKNAFETYTQQNSTLNHCPVSAFTEDNQFLWVGTEGGGINLIDKETGHIEYITSKNHLSSNNIKSLTTDNQGYVWIATFMGGLNQIKRGNDNTINGKVYRNNPSSPNSPLVDDIKKIINESDSGLWIAYQYSKPHISYLSLKDKKFTHIFLDDGDLNGYIFDILKQNEKYLWAITSEHLYRLDITTHAVEKIRLDDSAYTNLQTFCLDDSGNMWIGTIGSGVFKFDPNTYQYTALSEMIPNHIYSVFSIGYDDGSIWMGTDNGLFRYNIKQNDLLTFDQGEDTQGQVYYPLAIMKDKNGKFYFGGTGGFSVLDPAKISHNEHKPRVIISDFMVDHIPVESGKSGFYNEKGITLNHNQTDFGFKFSSDNYLIPEKNRFRYRLKGYDKRWIETDAGNRIALYSKVPPGTYYFEIYTANNDGIWGDTPAIIKVNRKPAPWLSKPAYLIYFTIMILLFLFILRHYKARKRLKMQLYLENVEKEKKEEIHQTQLRFFTNISHDFRTPLSLIIASLDKLRQEGLKEYYYRILNSNAKRLLNLVNELMDFRSIENDKMKLELQRTDINKYIQELGEDFIDYAHQRNIDYQILCDPALSKELYIDRNILEKIIMNLLNNAFKYTKNGGSISIETQVSPFQSAHKNNYTIQGDEPPGQVFSITIRDSGCGIPDNSIRHIFERFYKTNTTDYDSNLSTGIGLAFVKSLILLHRGIITVCSEEGQGTDISIQLSLNKDIYPEDHFLNTTEHNQDQSYPDGEDTAKNSSIDTPGNQIGQILSKNKKRILIAEDNDDLRHLLSDYLSKEYEIIQAKDGIEASNFIAQTNVDLIISDIMMPRKDGIIFSKEIKENIETSHIPLMLLTAKTSIESKLEGADSGADFYFEKPVDFQLLLLSVKNIFNQQQKLKDYFSKNYWTDTAELCSNEKDIHFLKQFTNIIEENLQNPDFDVNFIASGLSMSRSKLYSKIKTLSGKSIVEFILNCRLRKAAQLLTEQTLSIQQIMDEVGIESPSYFSRAFKKEFGQSPTDFLAKHKSPGSH